MRRAQAGDTVKVDYVGVLDDGSEFDHTRERGPMEFTIGGRQVLPGFENAVIGLAEGEAASVTLAPADAYGEHKAKFVSTLDRSRFPAELDITLGMTLVIPNGVGRKIKHTVTAIDGDQITIDGNHPLAGQTLSFTLTLAGFAEADPPSDDPSQD
ncbi:MAG: peptidylprolyl isomerase [Maricaulaceae bacterium]